MQSLHSINIQLFLVVIFLLFYSFVNANVVVNRDDKPYTPPVSKSANRTLYKSLYQKPSNSTPRFLNLTHHEVNPQRLAAAGEHSNSPRSLDLLKRQSGPSGTDQVSVAQRRNSVEQDVIPQAEDADQLRNLADPEGLRGVLDTMSLGN
ncbi:MAG: hypothetical protein Q9223_006796 [Gallowayella weberi]